MATRDRRYAVLDPKAPKNLYPNGHVRFFASRKTAIEFAKANGITTVDDWKTGTSIPVQLATNNKTGHTGQPKFLYVESDHGTAMLVGDFYVDREASEYMQRVESSIGKKKRWFLSSNPNYEGRDFSEIRTRRVHSNNRVMGASRRRNAPSTMFHAVVDRSGGTPGMFQPELIGSDPSLSTVRVRAKIAADTSGLPVAVLDDQHKLIKVYKPSAGSPTMHGAPFTERTPQTRRYAP